MLNIMAMPIHNPNKTLGVGIYYERDPEVLSQLEDWIAVKLERPLVLDERKIRLLEQEYATTSEDSAVAMSGAWRLRRDIIRQGYDGIIAVDGAHRVKIVHLRRARVEGPISETSRDRGTVIKLHRKRSGEFAFVRPSAGSLSADGVELIRRV